MHILNIAYRSVKYIWVDESKEFMCFVYVYHWGRTLQVDKRTSKKKYFFRCP